MINCHSAAPWRGRPQYWFLFRLLLAGFFWSGNACGQSLPAADADLPLLTHSAEIYNMQSPARDKRYRFRIEAIANYYDPVWNQFYGWDGTNTFFMIPGQRFDIKPGQRVLLTGEVVPATGFRAENLQVKVLAEINPSEVLSARGRLEDRAALNARLVEIDGLVDWQDQIDTKHQRLSLISEGHRIYTTVWLNEAGQAPLLTGAIVHTLGLYLPQVNIDNRFVGIELRVQGTENLQILGWLDKDARFEQPRIPLAQVAQALPGARLHVAGRIDSFAPGRTATIRDETGLLELRTPQERGLHVGAEIDAIGFRSTGTSDLYLDQVLWKPLGGTALDTPATTERPTVTLNLAAQVMELPSEKAAGQQPVKLSGVVTWGADGARFFYIQDRSGGVRVAVDPKVDVRRISSGLAVTVTGVTAMGDYAPEVIMRQADVGNTMSPPEPQRISLEQALTGASQARWVEMEGYVRGVEAASPWIQLDLTTATGEFRAILPPTVKVEDKIGAFVRIRGVCDVIANEFHRSTGVQLWMPIEEHIDVDEAPLSDPFAIPFTPLENLGLFGSGQSHSRRLNTAGTVTYQAPGRFLVIQSGTAHLLVLSRDKHVLVPGDLVNAVGIPGWDGTRAVLRESVTRKTGHEREPPTVKIRAPIPMGGWFDFRLVQIDGLLTEVTELGNEYYLTIRNGAENVVARIDQAQCPRLPETWRKGSAVTAIGVYRLRLDENRKATGVDLLLRTPADLVIVKFPPWWTVERALAVAAILGVCALGVILWVVLLRRRVQKQTEQIRRQMEKQTHLEAELERAERLHSLGLLAGGIAHDFNNLLTVIMGNTTLAMMDEVAMARVGDCLRNALAGSKRAQGLTQQVLTFAKGGDPVRESLSLPAVVNDSIAIALSGAKSRAEFNPPANLWLVHADRAQLGRAVQNVITNASLPMGGVIELEASNETVVENSPYPLVPGRYVRLTIADHGPGIPPDQLSGIFDPYAMAKLGKDQFGLATAYSIMKKHGGFIEVHSQLGHGTTMRLWIPAAEAAPPAPTGGSTPEPGQSQRVLLMDDEETIRNLGKRVLSRLNFETATAADGAECVRAYRAAFAAGRPFDLVIMDLTIPGGMGGMETITELRKIDPKVRAIVSSGYSNDPVLANFRDFGFQAVVAKPYDVNLLATVIDRVITKRL